MLIDLQRAFTPQEMGEWECGLCRRDFRVGSVIAMASTDAGGDIGRACPECVAYFGRINPEHFPTAEEFEELTRRYPEPIWASSEEADRAEDAGEFNYAATWVWRAPA